MAGAVAASNGIAFLVFVACGNTQEMGPHRGANLGGRLLFNSDGLDGTGRTHLRAAVTLGAAVATLVAHHRLHEGEQVIRGMQHLVGALCHTQLASHAVLLHVARAHRARRRDGVLALGHLLLLDGGKTTVHLLLGLRHSSCSNGNAAANEKRALALVDSLRVLSTLHFSLSTLYSALCTLHSILSTLYSILCTLHSVLSTTIAWTTVVDSVLVALVDAVAAGHAATVVNGAILVVDARRLAVAGAQATLDALVVVDVHLKQ